MEAGRGFSARRGRLSLVLFVLSAAASHPLLPQLTAPPCGRLAASLSSEGDGDGNRGGTPQVDSHCKNKKKVEEDKNPIGFSQSGNEAEGVFHFQQQMTGTFTLFVQSLVFFGPFIFLFFSNQGLSGKESDKPAANRL